MKYIDNGGTAPHDLVCILNYKHSLSDGEISRISEIENQKGNWTITFNEAPTFRTIIALVAIFEFELCHDSLSAIVYDGSRFEDLAGAAGNNIESLFSLLTILTRVSI
jgi:hypothetical protein